MSEMENVVMTIEEPTSKKSFLETLRENKNFGDSTFNLYISNLVRLNEGQVPKNLNFLKNTEAITAKIEKYKPNTQRTYYIAIVSLLKDIPKFKKTFDFYYDRMMNLNKELKTNTTKSETQKENWVNQEDITTLYNSITEEVRPLLEKKKLSGTEYEKVLKWVVLSLYTLQPPRRNADYQFCIVVNKWSPQLDTKYNYFDLSSATFYLNNYKTKKTYSTQEIKAPEELERVIKSYLKFHPLKSDLKKKTGAIPLLVDYIGSPFESVNSITRILNKIFGKKVGVSLLRNIYLTDKYSNKVEDLKEDAEAMGTSSNTILNNYIKVDETK
jgi:hypothetical protein